jgi:hypothetical protein
LLLTAAALLTTPLLYAPPAQAVPSPAPLTLVVLNPDGTPALDAVAVARINDYHRGFDGYASAPIYVSSPDRSGALSVTVPFTDPFIAKHFPAQKIYNVKVDLFTFSDPAHRTVKAYQAVNYLLNLGDPVLGSDPAGVNGSVVELVPVPAKPARAAVQDSLPDFDNCPPEPPSGASACMRISHPYYLQGEKVVLAHNVGQGLDMSTIFTISRTARATTTTVTGVDGLFLEAKGESNLSTSVTDHWTYYTPGLSSPYEDAALTENFAEVYTRECWATGCTETWDYPPDAVTGQSPMLPSDETVYHDQARDPAITNVDCTSAVVKSWENVNGANHDESWSFGWDVKGEYHGITLHAGATTKDTEAEESSTSYTWEVSGSQRPYHFVFVHGGHIGADADTGSVCPYNSPGSTYTHADWRDVSNPAKPQHINPPPETPEPVRGGAEDGQKKVDRCHEAPERCGRE